MRYKSHPWFRKRYGRKKPYTKIGITRLSCHRCGRKATRQWQVCADDNLWRPICDACDILLNTLVLWFVGDPKTTQKIRRYKKELANGA